MHSGKALLSIFFLLTFCNSYCQLDKLKGKWITAASDYMEIADTINEFDNSNMLGIAEKDEGMSFFIYGDTLSFQKRYYRHYTGNLDPDRLYIDRYDLKVLKLTDSVMLVSPITSLSRKFFSNRSRLLFTRQEYVIDTSIHLGKIIFHTTRCFGDCPVYHLQLDSTQQVKFYLEDIYTGKGFADDTALEGYFTGTLPDSIYQQLIQALQTCQLQTLTMPKILCCDGVVYTVIIYFNGQRRYYKSMMPPSIFEKVLGALYECCHVPGLQRITGPFDKHPPFVIEE